MALKFQGGKVQDTKMDRILARKRWADVLDQSMRGLVEIKNQIKSSQHASQTEDEMIDGAVFELRQLINRLRAAEK